MRYFYWFSRLYEHLDNLGLGRSGGVVYRRHIRSISDHRSDYDFLLFKTSCIVNIIYWKAPQKNRSKLMKTQKKWKLSTDVGAKLGRGERKYHNMTDSFSMIYYKTGPKKFENCRPLPPPRGSNLSHRNLCDLHFKFFTFDK